MYLSQLENKRLTLRSNERGVCKGVGISLKSRTLKYLLCNSLSVGDGASDFCIPVQAAEYFGEEIRLSRLRPVFPKGCAKLLLGRPLFTEDGVFLGNLEDAEFSGHALVRLISDRGENYPSSMLVASSDALLLRKRPAFPLGQRIPAPFLDKKTGKRDGYVTKAFLAKAIERGNLVRLTLSLPPFELFDGE